MNQEVTEKEINIEAVYPDVGERMSTEEREFVQQLKSEWKQPEVDQQSSHVQQGFNPYFSYPTQNLKVETIRSHKSWASLVSETVNWVNKNIHPLRIISISVVLCHSTKAGQCSIFYNDSKDELMKQKISPFVDHCLSAAIVDTAKNWEGHHKDVLKTASDYSAGGGVICISELETGLTHNRASSIVWFLKKC